MINGGLYSKIESAQSGYKVIFPDEVCLLVNDDGIRVYQEDSSSVLMEVKKTNQTNATWLDIEGHIGFEQETFVFTGNDGLHYAKYQRI